MSRFFQLSGLFAASSFVLLGCSDPEALRSKNTNLADPTLRALSGSWAYVNTFDAPANASDAELASADSDLGEPYAGYVLELSRGAGTAERDAEAYDDYGWATCHRSYDIAFSVTAAGFWSLREGWVRSSSNTSYTSSSLCSYVAEDRLWESSDPLPLVRVSLVGERLVVVSPASPPSRVRVHVFEHVR
jgi:hypothetical protein